MAEKKQIRIPRLLVYVLVFLAGVAITTAFGLVFGLEYAVDFITNAFIFGVIFIVCYNVGDKVERQKYRLDWHYWLMIALVLITDFLFLFASQATDWGVCKIRLAYFLVALIGSGFYAYFIYAPSQYAIFEQMKAESLAVITEIVNSPFAPEVKAEAILDAIFFPKKEEPAEEETKEEK